MLIKLKKYLFYGIKKDLALFFEAAQQAGFIEFIGTKRQMKELPFSLKNFLSAIKILKTQPVLFQKQDLSAEEAAKQILEIDKDIERLRAMEADLEKEVITAAPLGDFSPEDLLFVRKEANLIFQFFFIKSSEKVKKRVPPELIYISTEYDLDYYLSLSSEHKSYPGFVEIKITKPAKVLKKRLDMIRENILLLERKLKRYSSYLELLKAEVLNCYNGHNLQIAKNESALELEEHIFSIEGWVPKTKTEELRKLLETFLVEAEETTIGKKIRVPTCLENMPTAQIGEDLVKIYDIPSVTDKDPSLWVLGFFAFFFSIVVSDAGYGAIFLLLTLILKWRSKNKNPSAFLKRFIKLAFFLSFGCIIWGVFTASFFGMSFSPDHPWQKISIIEILIEKKAAYHLALKDDVYQTWTKQYPALKEVKTGHEFVVGALSKAGKYEVVNEFYRNVLLELSLLIGVFHITIAFVLNLRRNWAGVGWVLFLFGGYLWAPSILKSTSLIYFTHLLTKEMAIQIGNYMLFCSLPLVMILALIQRRLAGIKEIVGVIGIFGDVLSYLRLYALALAGMVLSQTFNSFGAQFGLAMGIVLIIFGHLVNITMSIMGGVIHGLRLNFLEWYNHCFEGGGKLFNPLRLFKK